MLDFVSCIIIGGGQAGLSAAYYLKKLGFEPVDSFDIPLSKMNYLHLDHYEKPGGAWQFRWPSLTLQTANHVHDLPGWGILESLGNDCGQIPASKAVPHYFDDYESKFGLKVLRQFHVYKVEEKEPGLYLVRIKSKDKEICVETKNIINATGTWDKPFWPYYPGEFRGLQIHSHDYVSPEKFKNKRILVIGGGITSVQLLEELYNAGVDVKWTSRKEPKFSDGFTVEDGRKAVAIVDQQVRQGLQPGAVVSVTGLLASQSFRDLYEQERILWKKMFIMLTKNGVKWADGSEEDFDVLLWCTGFKASLSHLSDLKIRNEHGGILMTGRLATEVEGKKGLQLLGYGPSASTIGANRAGREAAKIVADNYV